MKKFLYRSSVLAFTIALLLFSIFLMANNRNFYAKQYEENNTEKHTGMSMDSLLLSTDTLLDYLNDKSDSVYVTSEKFGVEKEVFDERETLHMVDVKNLYQMFFKIMLFLALSSFATLIYLFYKNGKKEFIREINLAFKFTIFVAVIIVAASTFAFVYDFNGFWILFHEILFTNDLFYLDPKISTMINMFPLEFFLSMCVKIVEIFSFLFMAFFLVSKILSDNYAKHWYK